MSYRCARSHRFTLLACDLALRCGPTRYERTRYCLLRPQAPLPANDAASQDVETPKRCGRLQRCDGRPPPARDPHQHPARRRSTTNEAGGAETGHLPLRPLLQFYGLLCGRRGARGDLPLRRAIHQTGSCDTTARRAGAEAPYSALGPRLRPLGRLRGRAGQTGWGTGRAAS